MSNWKKELWNAVDDNNISAFDSILSRSDVKSQIKDIDEWKSCEDPLHQAAARGYDEMLTKLINFGAKVNAYSYFDTDKNTALHWAAFQNKTSCVKILIGNGADQNMHGQCKTCLAIIFGIKQQVLIVYS